MRRYIALLSLAVSTACVPEAGTIPEGSNEVPAAAVSQPAKDEIIGKYVVKLVNGAPPTINIQGHEPTITISKERIHFQSQCIYADWTYQRDGETISTKPWFEPGSGMCARGLAPGETAIQEAFDKATVIRRIGSGLHVEGGSYQLQLDGIADRAGIDPRADDMPPH